MGVPRSVSMFDLKMIPGSAGIMQRNDKQEINELLWQLGFDTKSEIEFINCLHRPLTAKTKEPIMGVLITGTERQDKEWLSSDDVSTEAKVEYCEDGYMRDELLALNKQSNFTDSIIKHIKDNYKEDKE